MANQKLVIYDSGELQKTGATQRIDIYGADFAENVAITGTLGVTGASTLAGLSATTGLFSSTLGVTGATTLSSTLGVSGVTSLAALNAGATAITGTLSSSDKATLNSLEVTVLSDLKGNLAVAGTSSLVGAVTTTAGVSVGGALAVTGTSTLTGAASLSSTLGVSGATTLSSTLGVTGATTLSSTLAVTGAATLSGGLGVTGAITGSDTIATTNGGTFGSLTTAGTLNAGATTLGNTTVGSLGASGATTLSSTLGVSGATTLSSTLAVTDAATLSSTLGVTGATSLASTLGVTGAATLSSTLGVSGATTLSSTLGVSGAATLSSTLGVTGATTLTGAVTASSTLGVTGVANFANDVNVTGDLTVSGSVISRGEVDVIIRDAFLDLAFGDYTGGVSSGGFTVSMNKAVGFAAENVSAFTAGAGEVAPSFTVGGATAFAIGDIVAIAGAEASENDGLFAVKAINGSVISIESAKIGSAPFLQNQFVTASGQTAKAYKVDLAAVAVADGANFPQSGGVAFNKGTFITLYKTAASLTGAAANNVTANGAWTSVGEVGLNEAYGVDNTINLTNSRNLVVNKPGGANTAAIQYTSNAASFYRTSEANLSLGVWDAAASNAKSKIDFLANGVDYDISLSSASTISAVALNVSEQAKGGSGSWKVTDAGNGNKGELSIAQTGEVILKSYTNNVNLDAGNNNVVAIASDTMFNANGANVASLGYNLSVGAGVAAKKVVAASGAAASPTVPNVMGVTLAAESSGKANVCTMHGSLVQVVSPDSFVGGDIGKVVYLVSNGDVSKTPPSNPNDYVMRVGYVVAIPGAATEPVIQFAPQFIAKVL